jgi:hypothetical protein
MTEADWLQGIPCDRHEDPWCGTCRPGKYDGFPTTVYITQGWSSAFHSSMACSALTNGQAFVQRRGGAPAPMSAVAVAVAFKTHLPCLICFPPPVPTN